MTTVELTVDHDDEDIMTTSTPSGHEVTMDSKSKPGGEGPTPVELLLASAAACSLMDVRLILEKKKYEVTDLRVHAEGARREDHPRRFEDLHLTFEVGGGVTKKDLEDACELSVEKYCSVLATLQTSPNLSWTANPTG